MVMAQPQQIGRRSWQFVLEMIVKDTWETHLIGVIIGLSVIQLSAGLQSSLSLLVLKWDDPPSRSLRLATWVNALFLGLGYALWIRGFLNRPSWPISGHFNPCFWGRRPKVCQKQEVLDGFGDSNPMFLEPVSQALQYQRGDATRLAKKVKITKCIPQPLMCGSDHPPDFSQPTKMEVSWKYPSTPKSSKTRTLDLFGTVAGRIEWPWREVTKLTCLDWDLRILHGGGSNLGTVRQNGVVHHKMTRI